MAECRIEMEWQLCELWAGLGTGVEKWCGLGDSERWGSCSNKTQEEDWDLGVTVHMAQSLG